MISIEVRKAAVTRAERWTTCPTSRGRLQGTWEVRGHSFECLEQSVHFPHTTGAACDTGGVVAFWMRPSRGATQLTWRRRRGEVCFFFVGLDGLFLWVYVEAA
jgi:hypothetical protein